MLASILALVVGLGSLTIYLAAFFFPEIHRKNDFIWSGVGLFYALVIWVFAPRITGGLFLGHVASVALLVWFGWQTLTLRRQLTPQVQQTPLPSTETVKASVLQQSSKFSPLGKLGEFKNSIGRIFSSGKNRIQETVSKKPPVTPQPSIAEVIATSIPEESVAETKIETVSDTTVIPEPPVEEIKIETVPEVIAPSSSHPELVATVESEVEEEKAIPTEEVVPDAVLTPVADIPPESTPPKSAN